VLTKPVSGRRLRRALTEALGMLSHQAASGQENVVPDPSLRILVAEDHLLSQKVIRGMLGKLGLDADVVGNGLEALAAVQEKQYDLILMDCEMPVMDGITATEKIREIEARANLPRTPVVALTAHVLQEQRERMQKAGMDQFLSKPVRKDAVQKLLSELGLEKRLQLVRSDLRREK